MTKYVTDRDVPSSAVDQALYAEQNEVPNPELSGLQATHEEIALRAFELWRARGYFEGSSEIDWFRAEQE